MSINRSRWSVWFGLGLGLGMLAVDGLSAQLLRPLPEFVEVRGERAFSGRVIVRPIQREEAAARRMSEEGFQQLRGQAAREMMNLGIQRAFPEVDEYLLPVPPGQTENALARRLMATGAFSYVEPDWIVYPVNCGNDPQYSQQWHHAANRMDTCGAWALTTGVPAVVVAICDTGVRATHEDLLLNRQEGFHVPTQRWESQGGPVNDIQGHGTACTGSAAANGNNALGLAGMGWNLGHRMMRVTDSADGSASLANLTLAARTAADRGDKVASVSYSGVTSSSVFTTGTYVRSKGALLVWAAGNSNVNMSGNRNDDVIVVGATDQNDAKASFSSYGSLVDLVAPGVGIRTTSNAGNTSYSSVSGTSFSTPIVAGLCGLIWSRNPNLTPAEVETILRSTCDDLGAAGVDDIFGHGRVDAARALAATPDPNVDLPPAAPTGLAATPGDRQVVLSWNASSESDLAGYSVWRSTDNVNFTELTTALLPNPGYTDTGLINGTLYYYAVYAEDQAGKESTPARVSATPVAPPPVSTLAGETFDSGSLAGTGWVTQNGSAFVSSAAAFEGGFGLRLQQTTWAERAISTVGYRNITVSYARRTISLSSNQRLVVEWWNGSSWSAVESVRSDIYSRVTFAMPSGAANNAAFKLRFRLNGNSTSRQANVDSVVLTGTPVAP